MLSRLSIAALWSPSGKGLTSSLSLAMLNSVLVTFPCGILSQAWYLIVLIPDLCQHFLLCKKVMYNDCLTYAELYV